MRNKESGKQIKVNYENGRENANGNELIIQEIETVLLSCVECVIGKEA